MRTAPFKLAKTCCCCLKRTWPADNRVVLYGRKTIHDTRSYARAGGQTHVFRWAHPGCARIDNAFCLRSRIEAARRDYDEMVEDYPAKEERWRRSRDARFTAALVEAVSFWREQSVEEVAR